VLEIRLYKFKKIKEMHKVILKKGSNIRVTKGHPWVYSNEIDNFSLLKELPAGSIVELVDHASYFVAIGYFNPRSLISVRLMSYNKSEKLDKEFFVKKIENALSFREKIFANQENEIDFCRLIHSEGDGLPGLVIDRFKNIFSCQITTAGMEQFKSLIVEALKSVFNNDISIIFRNDLEIRKLEGLELYSENINFDNQNLITLQENGLNFLVDIKNSQKTGWFFDQRKNHYFVRSIANNLKVLDAFSYLGGFGFNALAGNAKEVTFVDISTTAIDLISKTADSFYSDKKDKIKIINKKVFDLLEDEEFQKQSFDLVILDPPAFIKSKKDIFSGIKGYEKLIKLASKLVAKQGFLMFSSCSHHLTVDDMINCANDGFRKAGRKAKLFRVFGADFDHPTLPSLREGEYLKSLCFNVE